MGEYSKALEFYQKSLEINQNILPLNHLEFSIIYNNIGLSHAHIGDHWKALEFYEKSLEIQRKILPENHPNLATINTITLVQSMKTLRNTQKHFHFTNMLFKLHNKFCLKIISLKC